MFDGRAESLVEHDLGGESIRSCRREEGPVRLIADTLAHDERSFDSPSTTGS